jgi:hypothetical protein
MIRLKYLSKLPHARQMITLETQTRAGTHKTKSTAFIFQRVFRTSLFSRYSIIKMPTKIDKVKGLQMCNTVMGKQTVEIFLTKF